MKQGGNSFELHLIESNHLRCTKNLKKKKENGREGAGELEIAKSAYIFTATI